MTTPPYLSTLFFLVPSFDLPSPAAENVNIPPFLLPLCIPSLCSPTPDPNPYSTLCRAQPQLHVAQVQIGLLDPPIWRDVLWLVTLHVLLHGGQAGAILQADGALVGRGAVVGAQMFDHGRVVPRALVTQLALERLLTCEGENGRRGQSAQGQTNLPKVWPRTKMKPRQSRIYLNR